MLEAQTFPAINSFRSPAADPDNQQPANRTRTADQQYLLLLFFILTFFPACKKEQPLPMPEEKFVKVLCDIHIAEAAMESVKANEKDSVATLLYQQIYAIHGVDGALVDSTLAMVKGDPQIAERVYLKVTEELAKLKVTNE